MRKRFVNKKISIVKYLIRWCAVLMLLFGVFTVFCVDIMSDNAVRGAATKEMSKQMRMAAKCAKKDDGQISFTDDLDNIDSNFWMVILDSKGNLIAGGYPPEYDPAKDYSGKIHFRTIECGDNVFYVEDRVDLLNRKAGINGGYVLRGIVNKKDIATVYQELKRYSYIALLVEIVFMVIASILLQRRISKPMLQMCEQALQIGEDLALSERIEYDGKFSELDILLQAYNKLLTRMENVISRQRQFNSDVSHELKTPVTVIRAQCQLTKEQLAAGKDVAIDEMIAIIERQSNRMSQIIEQLLSLSRMDQNKMSFELEEIDLVDVVEFVCEDEGAATGDETRFDYDLASTLVMADVVLITMAVRNLVSNAIKYSDKGTKIKVGCGRNDSGAYVSVQDFGRGIASEDQVRIFEHYYRTEQSRNSEGFGLGLTLAMKIAEKHGGTIYVKSSLGEGSTFTLVIP